MSAETSAYEPVIVPALHRIQREHGCLPREALERLAKDLDLPLHRLQSVASFFPHFQLTAPREVTVRICRDMACRMAGSAEILRDLTAAAGGDVSVEGVSCLGRCDRAPAGCIAVHGGGHERYFLGRSIDQWQAIIEIAGAEVPPPADDDAGRKVDMTEWRIDPYAGGARDYGATKKAIAARDASLEAATQILRMRDRWGSGASDQFRVVATRQGRAPFALAQQTSDAVLDWQTESGWAKGPALGGWADPLLDELIAGDLRGMGGAGIPAAQKWRDVRDAVREARRRGDDARAFIVVNGDESEPGTFKDRELLLRLPHLVVEGVILAGLITEATQGFIYIRHEYSEQIEACRAEIRRAEQLGLCGEKPSALGRPFPISVFASPGGYICGEQSALIEAMSDRRGEPRNMPPKLETNGLADLPTLVSNVETFAWTPFIVQHGGKAYAAEGVNGWKGRRIFSVSGDVKRPGVYEVPMGLSLRGLICGEKYCQGIAGDRPLKAIAPSGPSGGFLPAKLTAKAGLPREHLKNKNWLALAGRQGLNPEADELDVLDLELELNLFRAMSPTQALGAGIVVYAEGRDMAREALNSMEFFRNESCGKCVPCRLGSQKLVSLGTNLVQDQISADRWKQELLPVVGELGKAIELASICGLGRSVPVPLRTVINYFPGDIAAHLTGAAAEPPR